jgi:hypothetical protein
MHNQGFLSPEWIGAYLVDTPDNNNFMKDERAEKSNNKDRLLEIFQFFIAFSFQPPAGCSLGGEMFISIYISASLRHRAG